MSDQIGCIVVPTPVNSGLTFPFTTRYPHGVSVDWPVITHRFGTLDAMQEQRFIIGTGPRKFQFNRTLNLRTERYALRDFWEARKGPWEAFTYNYFDASGSSGSVLVNFEQQPISFEYLRNACKVGLTLVETGDPSTAPVYAVSSTCSRFPSSLLKTALTAEVQVIIPLIHIKVREAGVPEIYISDRRCTVGGQLYLPRITDIGDAKSGVLLVQDIKGSANEFRFTCGNADRVMTQLVNDTDLKYAEIDFSFYHVNSGILLTLWAGVVQDFGSDSGSSQFPINCSDGFFQIMNQYPPKQLGRQCWKDYNDGLACPWATAGRSSGDVISAGGDPASCDFYFDSANGCQIHGMDKYFGGQPAQPQGVTIKDDSTGFLGFGRNTVTATSIVSETMWGQSLADTWCNSGGDPNKAFMAKAVIAAYRDESPYADALGIIGQGPIGGFTPAQVAQTVDGFRYVVAPTLDGFTPQGFQVDGSLNIKANQPGYGLRNIPGNDPVNPPTDSFSLGQGTPQVWGPQMAAGTAACEIRIRKSSTITPSTPDQHSMIVPLDYGLAGWTWDAAGNRTAVRGLTNPFWIAINTLLRASGLISFIPVAMNFNNITVTLPPSSFFGYSGATIGLFTIGLITGSPAALVAGLVGLIGGAFTGNAYSVPMGQAANQAEVLLLLNINTWHSLAPTYRTTANRATFASNYDTIWNAYVAACNVIFQGNPNGDDARKALNRSIGDRQRGGKFDWFAAYRDPITSDATPGDTLIATDSSAAQLAKFVLPSVFAGDGSGTAEIADLVVPAILGGGTEFQFQFQGQIASPKPFRDWLNEILATALGYFTWESGKLKLGIRVNASAVDAYTEGSTILQSLRTAPINAAFEKIELSFADVAYQYQANVGRYVDKSHAAYYGRSGAPLVTQMHSVGVSTLSQALRIAATRTREEIGGVRATEWRDAREASWATTLLGLANEVGQVVSQTHAIEIPGLHGTCNVTGATVTRASGDSWDGSLYTAGGVLASSLLNKEAVINGVRVLISAVSIVAGAVASVTVMPAPGDGSGLSFRVITMSFRIGRYTLKKDYSVLIEGQTVTESMYDLEQGPKPIDVQPAPLPSMRFPIPLGPAWAPYQVQAAANDALFPSEYTFDVDQEYIPLTDTGVAASLIISGKLPVNKFSATGAGAPVVGSVSQAVTGGNLPASATIRVVLLALDAAGLPTAPAKVLIIGTSVGGADTFTLANIVWPAVAGLTSWVLFASTQDDLICAQATGALTPTGGGTTYTPGSITFGGSLARSTWALPSPAVSRLRIKAKPGINHGIAGVKVTSVSSGHIISSDMIGATIHSGASFVGRFVSVIGRPTGSTPYASYLITAFNSGTGDMTVSPDPNGVVLAGDALVIRNQVDAPNAAPYTSVSDTGYLNSLENGSAGLTANSLKGCLLRVIQGAGRGATPRKITANTDRAISWDLPLEMDGTTVWIIEGPTWQFPADSTNIDNGDPQTVVSMSVPAENFTRQPMVIGVFTIDIYGNESPDGDAPIREDWIYGAPGIADGYYTVTPDMSGNVTIDLANGLSQRLVLTATAVTVLPPIFTGGSIAAGKWFSLYLDQDGTGGRAIPTFTVGAGGFAADVQAEQIDGTASTRTSYQLTFHGTRWCLDAPIRTAGAIT